VPAPGKVPLASGACSARAGACEEERSNQHEHGWLA
jgi:hypothetical protein